MLRVSIIYLSKKKEKDGTEVIGNIIHCKNHKSRLTKENKMVDVRLTYDKGLDRYYGLLELAEKYEIFKKVSTRYELPDGSKQFGKAILSDPTTYFTNDIMHQLDLAAESQNDGLVLIKTQSYILHLDICNEGYLLANY
jgi:hypothetical protein